MYIDTHLHLFKEYYDDINAIIKRAKDNGVSKLIVNGCDLKTNNEVLELVNKYDIVYGCLGFQPTELDEFKKEDLEWLKKNIDHKKIVGIGEIGLDYHYENTNKELQQFVFEKQLEIAKKRNLPVIVHSRDSIKETYDTLNKYNNRGIIHCYSGSLDMAKEFIKIGFFLGIGGVSTYKNSRILKEVINGIGLEYLVLETDSPYLSPEPVRNTKNEPLNLVIIARSIAEIKGCNVKLVGRVTSFNASSIFDF